MKRAMKRERYCQKHKAEWHNGVVEWCNKSSKGAHFTFCTLCYKYLSIRSGGITYLKRYAQCKAHLKNVYVRNSNNDISSHFLPTRLDDKVSKAKMLWPVFSVEHQLGFIISDHATKRFVKGSQIHKLLQHVHVGEQKQKQWSAMLLQMS